MVDALEKSTAFPHSDQSSEYLPVPPTRPECGEGQAWPLVLRGLSLLTQEDIAADLGPGFLSLLQMHLFCGHDRGSLSAYLPPSLLGDRFTWFHMGGGPNPVGHEWTFLPSVLRQQRSLRTQGE